MVRSGVAALCCRFLLTMVLAASTVLAQATPILIPSPAPQPTETFTYRGILADVFCVDAKIALDGADMLAAPQQHTLHCLVDIPRCWETSPFCLMNRDSTNDQRWGCAYTFSQEETWSLRNYLKATTANRANLVVDVSGQWNLTTERLMVNTTATTFVYPPGSALPMTLGLAVAVIATLAVGAIGGVLHHKRVNFSTTARTVLRAAVVVLMAGLIVMVILTGYIGFESVGVPVPFARALGTTMGFLFFLVLLPTTKHFGIGHLIGVSYEEFIKFHVLAGLTLWVVMTVHGSLMFNAFAEVEPNAAFLFRFEGKKTINGAGFVAWVLLSLLVVTGLVRRWFYAVFRVVHVLFVLTVVMAIVHHLLVGVFIVPPLLLYGVDMVLRVRQTSKAEPSVTQLRTLPGANATHVVLRLGALRLQAWTLAGQHVLLRMRAFGIVEQHPFTLAWYDTASHEAHFIVRPTRPEAWTGKLMQIAQQAQRHTDGTLERREAEQNEEDVQRSALLDNKGLGAVSWTGPFGGLRVQLDSVERVLVVVGGVGVTFLTNLLSAIVQGPEKAFPRLVLLRGVWIVRESALVDLVIPVLRRAADLLKASTLRPTLGGSTQRQIDVVIYVTGAEKPQEMTTKVDPLLTERSSGAATKTDEAQGVPGRGGLLPDMVSIQYTRPDIAGVAQAFVSQASNKPGQTVMYACGPAGMAKSTQDAAESCGMLYDEQVFSIGP